MIKMIVFYIIIFNIMSAAIARYAWGGRFTYNKKASPSYNGKMILVSGMLSQPGSAYGLITMPYGCSLCLNYSVFGFNPRNAGKQLKGLARDKDYIVGTSVGCKAIVFSKTDNNHRVFISPATHSIILKAEYQTKLQLLAPIAELLTLLLGWLAIIPFIKTGTGDHYSLALLVDQLFWVYYDDPKFDDIKNMRKTGLILSSDDEFLENDIITGIYTTAKERITICASHAQTANKKSSADYEIAIQTLLA